MMRIFTILQGQNIAGIQQDDPRRHNQNLRPVKPSTSSELNRSPQSSAFASAQSAKLVPGRLGSSLFRGATVITSSVWPVGTSGGRVRTTRRSSWTSVLIRKVIMMGLLFQFILAVLLRPW